MPLQLSAFGRVLACQLIRLFQFTAYGGRLLVDLHLVPTLLQEVSPVVVATVCVSEGDVFQIVIGFVEAVFHHVRKRRMPTGDHVDEHRLACSVPAYDGNMFALFQTEVHRLGHRPFRLPRPGIYHLNRLHHREYNIFYLTTTMTTQTTFDLWSSRKKLSKLS